MVVSESPPRLEELDPRLARKFLREYQGYELRVADMEAVIPMYRCLKPEDLETLYECTEDDLREKNIRVIMRRVAKVAREAPVLGAERQQVPIAAASAGEDPGVVSSQEEVAAPEEIAGVREEVEQLFDSDEDTELPGREVVRNSNEHIEEMLILMFGPAEPAEAMVLLKNIKMTKDAPFSKLSLATNYRRDWKMTLKWCKNHRLKGKTLVKNFLYGIQPRKLASALECLEYEKIEEVMDAFVKAYKTKVKARNDLTGMDLFADEKPAARAAGKQEKQSEKSPGSVKKAGGNAASGADERNPNAGAIAAVRQCWKCGSKDHVRSDCPMLKERNGVNRIGSLSAVSAKQNGPYLTVELSPTVGSPDSKQVIRVQGFFDSGSDVNAVGQNMVKHLELYGGETYLLDSPMEVIWLDKEVKRMVTHAIDMKLVIVGVDIEVKLTFLIVPWDMDQVIVGWESQVKYQFADQLLNWIKLQRDLHINIGSSISDDNVKLTDMDGQPVSIDQYLFVDEHVDESDSQDTVLSEEESAAVDKLLEEFSDVFEEKPVGSAQVKPMEVEMKPEWKPPPMGPPRRYSPKVQTAIDFDLQKQLDKGIVIPCPEAEFASDAHAVPKPDSESGFRFCIDYRVLNNGAVSTPYPLPKITDIHSSLAGKSYVGKMDLRWGYWQFPVAENSRKRLAFRVRGKYYTYTVCAMGYKNSGYHVQAEMSKGFYHLIGDGVFIYLDDLILYADTFEKFLEVLRAVLTTFRRLKLSCKKEKCGFGLAELPVLGHVWTRAAFKMADSRKAAVDAIPFPRSVFELRRFLGMTNYQRMYIPRYAMMSKPLSSQVNVPISLWNRSEMEIAFRAMKKAVQDQAQLTHLDYSLPLVLQTDGSILGVAAMLANRLADGTYRIVAYFSHALTE